MGFEGDIRKIDRHKRRAYIDVSLFGRTVHTHSRVFPLSLHQPVTQLLAEITCTSARSSSSLL